MNENEEQSKRVKCPFCAELILPEAVVCRFCHSDLAKKQAKTEQPPGIWRAIILNLVCPGLGAWRCGHRNRGAITMLILVGALLLGTLQLTELINKKVATAIRTGNMQGIYSISEDAQSNIWFQVFFYGYIISFIDLWFLVKNNRNSIEQKSRDEPKKQ